MEIVSIPVGDKFILYRPLLGLAFVGNRAMERVVLGLPQGKTRSPTDIPPAVLDYLEGIGFLESDPPPPEPPQTEYRPTNAVLLLTNRCNLRCIYCYADAGEGEAQEVSFELARAAIDHVHQNALDLGRERFALTFHGGGEPIAAWQALQEAVAHARSKTLPCTISMVSNGIWTECQADWVLHNLDRLTISLDGGPGTQDRQRPLASGRGSFQAVKKTIEILDRHDFDYGIRMTALPPWRGQLAADVEFICNETACGTIQVEPAFNDTRGEYRPPTQQESQDFAAGFMEAFAIAERAGRRFYFSGARPGTLTSTFCTAPYGGLIVTPAGDLVTCYEITDARHPLAEPCTIGRIENGRVVIDEAKRNAVMARLEARREGCRDCFCYWHCAGDCHAKAFHPGGDATQETSARCQMNQSILAQMLLWHIAESEDGVYRGYELEELAEYAE